MIQLNFNINKNFKQNLMKKFFALISFCILIAMQSCSSEEDLMFNESNSSDASLSHLVIKFENQIYETDVITIGDSVKYLNEEYEEVYRSKIVNIPNIAAVVSTNESGTSFVEYFYSEKNLLDKYNFIQLENKSEQMTGKSTRSGVIDMMVPNNTSPILAVAELYDDRNFKDTKLISYATASWATGIPKLKDLGFNDKTSSIKVFNKMSPNSSYTIQYTNVGLPHQKTYSGSGIRPVLTCFEDSNYSGSVIYCIASPTGSSTDHIDTNLKNIGWNDKVSAIGWTLVVDFSAFNGENPQIPAHPAC